MTRDSQNTSDASSTKTRHFHLARAIFWWLGAPVLIIVLGWQTSVYLVILLSCYANGAADFSAYTARHAEDET